MLPALATPSRAIGGIRAQRALVSTTGIACIEPFLVAPVPHFGVAKQITQRELRNNSGDIMRQLDHGESFVVTRNGIPVGELSPLRRHRFVSAEAAVAAFKDAPRVEFDRFRADLDRAASQQIAPRG